MSVIIKTKTAAQLLADKQKSNNAVDPEEYQKIKEQRIKEMKKPKKVVKAKIVHSTKTKTKADGDDETPYDCSFEEEEMDSWESVEEDIKSVKEIDPKNDAKRVKKSMAMLGRKTPSEKIKVQLDTDYDVEDIDAFTAAREYDNKKEKLTIVNLENLDKIIKKDMKGKRDILLVGLSESVKDAISDLLMETEIGKAGRIFDTSLEENELLTVPKTSIAMFSEKVPILPLDQRDEDSSEDGIKARTRATEKQKKVAAKQTTKHANKKVIAVGEDHIEEAFDIKKDYPSVRFIFLVKVSAIERVDLKKLHYNVAPFTPLEKFKKKFIALNRAECLVVDLENKNQIYHMEID